jgi:hypothetical protein
LLEEVPCETDGQLGGVDLPQRLADHGR